MKSPTRGSLRRTASWTAPILAAAAFIAAGPVSGLVTGAASAELPPRSAAQLLVDVQKANLDGFSGTVVASASLGLPDLPGNLTDDGSGSGIGPLGLLTGSHTMRVWYAGPRQARVSLLSQYGESDVIRSGSDLWQWSSSSRTARHWALPARPSGPAMSPGIGAGPAQAQLQLTPQEAADQALAALSPTTVVTGNGTTAVAGRQAYVLSLQPRSTTTLVGSVRIAIDGKTHVPTQVQVFARGATSPAVSVGFSSFDPSAPSASAFTFDPPPGTTVTQERLSQRTTAVTHEKLTQRTPMTGTAGPATLPAGGPGGARVVGTGWDQVVVGTLPQLPTAQLPTTRLPTAQFRTVGGQGAPGPSNAQQAQLDELLRQFPRVSGAWGSGRLFAGTLMSVVVTDDHRVAVGLVPPAQLYAALAAR